MAYGEQPSIRSEGISWRGAADEAKAMQIVCRDGVLLRGHVWRAQAETFYGQVIINAATGVPARYYNSYAQFLAASGFEVLTYDYRGIGLSRPASLRGSGFRWRDWGDRDFEAAVMFMQEQKARANRTDGPLLVVGHSIGGYLPGLASNANLVDRMLTMGAQYAYWRDYAPEKRSRLLFKWHIAMPLLTAAFGYFPGKRLGWLEDLPAGVAYEWGFRRAKMEDSHPPAARQATVDRFAAVTAPILAITMADDELGTLPAIRRTLAYYQNASRTVVMLSPKDYGLDSIGHLGLFHDRHAEGFWRDTLAWLQHGVNPWEAQVV